MSKPCYASLALTGVLLVACFVSTNAYQTHTSASAAFAAGAMPGLHRLAEDYCIRKGFAAVHTYQVAGFVQVAGEMDAIFHNVHCTTRTGSDNKAAADEDWAGLKQAIYAEPVIVGTIDEHPQKEPR